MASLFGEAIERGARGINAADSVNGLFEAWLAFLREMATFPLTKHDFEFAVNQVIKRRHELLASGDPTAADQQRPMFYVVHSPDEPAVNDR
jgi:hypothetical protein